MSAPSANPPASAEPQEVPVFLVAGQSNAVGLDAPIRAHLERRLGGRIELVAVAEGGCPLARLPHYVRKTWHPDIRNQKYDELIAAVRERLAGLAAGGRRPVLKALFWMQGEQDAKTAAAGPEGTSLPPPPQSATYQAYEANLRAFIAAVRRDLGAPDLAVIIGETKIGNPPTFQLATSQHLGTPAVRSAQARVAASDKRAALVPTGHCEQGPDLLHFTAAGLAALAEAMVGAYVAFDPPPRRPTPARAVPCTILLLAAMGAAASVRGGPPAAETEARPAGLPWYARRARQTPAFDVPRLDGIAVDGAADDWGDRGFRVEAMTPYEKPGAAIEFQPRFRLAWNDRGLLDLGEFQGIPILLPRAFHERLR